MKSLWKIWCENALQKKKIIRKKAKKRNHRDVTVTGFIFEFQRFPRTITYFASNTLTYQICLQTALLWLVTKPHFYSHLWWKWSPKYYRISIHSQSNNFTLSLLMDKLKPNILEVFPRWPCSPLFNEKRFAQAYLTKKLWRYTKTKWRIRKPLFVLLCCNFSWDWHICHL